jgi:hypothetical protein
MARFPGLYIPLVNFFFNGPEPTDTQFPSISIVRQYDGFGDWPLYPINFLADLNAVVVMLVVHTDYEAVSLDPNDPRFVPGTRVEKFGDTTYYTIPIQDLPVLFPLRLIGVPEQFIDAFEPVVRWGVELGYDRTITPGEPTPARLIPIINPFKAIDDLIAAINEGIDNALGTLIRRRRWRSRRRTPPRRHPTPRRRRPNRDLSRAGRRLSRAGRYRGAITRQLRSRRRGLRKPNRPANAPPRRPPNSPPRPKRSPSRRTPPRPSGQPPPPHRSPQMRRGHRRRIRRNPGCADPTGFSVRGSGSCCTAATPSPRPPRPTLTRPRPRRPRALPPVRPPTPIHSSVADHVERRHR